MGLLRTQVSDWAVNVLLTHLKTYFARGNFAGLASMELIYSLVARSSSYWLPSLLCVALNVLQLVVEHIEHTSLFGGDSISGTGFLATCGCEAKTSNLRQSKTFCPTESSK